MTVKSGLCFACLYVYMVFRYRLDQPGLLLVSIMTHQHIQRRLRDAVGGIEERGIKPDARTVGGYIDDGALVPLLEE